MEIVHVDPGYGRLMQLDSNAQVACTENAEYNPYSGVAFNLTSGSRIYFPNVDFTFEPTAGQLYKKVWSIKFSAYLDGGTVYVGFCRSISSFTSPDVGVHLKSNTSTIRRYIDGAVNEKRDFAQTPIGFHNVSITYAVTADGTGNYTSTSTITVDDTTDFQTYTSAEIPTIPQYIGCSFSTTYKCYISNVLVGQASYEGDGTGSIPSDDGIPADTPIYRLPLGDPVTNFTEGEDGEYIGTENGQTLLQAVNSSTLIATHGNRPINHIVAYGAPGYRVGSAVSSATGISKSNDSDTISHGNHTLSFDKTMHVYDVWKIGDGNTFSDINGLQVGWRAGE